MPRHLYDVVSAFDAVSVTAQKAYGRLGNEAAQRLRLAAELFRQGVHFAGEWRTAIGVAMRRILHSTNRYVRRRYAAWLRWLDGPFCTWGLRLPISLVFLFVLLHHFSEAADALQSAWNARPLRITFIHAVAHALVDPSFQELLSRFLVWGTIASVSAVHAIETIVDLFSRAYFGKIFRKRPIVKFGLALVLFVIAVLIWKALRLG